MRIKELEADSENERKRGMNDNISSRPFHVERNEINVLIKYIPFDCVKL